MNLIYKSLRSPNFVLWLHYWAIIVFVLYVFVEQNYADFDLWGKMAIGALWEQNYPRFPYQDVFSYTAPLASWRDHEWGSGVLYYFLVRHWGSGSLFLLRALLYTATLWIVFKSFLLSVPKTLTPSQRNWIHLLFIWILLVFIPTWLPGYMATLRCQLFTYFFYPLFLFLLERYRRGLRFQNLVFFLPLLTLLWVNLHGGFSTGFLAIGLYGIWITWQRAWKKAITLWLILLLSMGTVLINPYGWDFVPQIIQGWLHPRTFISEWANIFVALGPVVGVVYSLILLSVLYFGVRQWMKAPTAFSGILLLLFALTGLEGWLHAKLSVIFVLSLLCLGLNLGIPPLWKIPSSKFIETYRQVLTDTYRFILPLCMILIGGVMIGKHLVMDSHPLAVRVPGCRAKTQILYPTGVVEFIKQHKLHGNLWCTFDWGQFLFWHIYPQMKISLDGRYEAVYPESVLIKNVRFYFPPYEMNSPLLYPTTHLLIPKEYQEVIRKLRHNPHWHLIYEDNVAQLYSDTTEPETTHPLSQQKKMEFLDDHLGVLSRFKHSF